MSLRPVLEKLVAKLANAPEEPPRSEASKSWGTPGEASEAAAAKALEQAKSNARLTKLFTALTLLVGIVVVGVVAYNIYLHPAAPRPVGTAVIKISGTESFRGEVGTLNRYGTHTIEGTAPVTVEFPYGRADHVSAAMERSSGTVEICVKPDALTENPGEASDDCKTVARSSDSDALVMWKAPRQ